VRQRLPNLIGIVGGISFVAFGAWAMAAPESFFDRIARFEPYNQHFVQDIGAFQLGLGAVLLLATLTTRIDPLALALLGTGAGAAAHAASHVLGRDLGGRPTSDIPTFAVLAVLLLGAGFARTTQAGD
jgi:hypothetical protein